MEQIRIELEAEHVPIFRELALWTMGSEAHRLSEAATERADKRDSWEDNVPAEHLAMLTELGDVLREIGWAPLDDEEPVTLSLPKYLAESICDYARGSWIRDELSYAVSKDLPKRAIALATFNDWIDIDGPPPAKVLASA